MGIVKTQGMQGLRGLSGLSASERNLWRKQNAEKLKGLPNYAENILYANQQYIAKYGQDSFNNTPKEVRDKRFKDDIVQEEYVKKFSPWEVGKDKEGNTFPKVNPNRGFGNAEDFDRYNLLDTQGKIELLESGYKPNWEIEKETSEKEKKNEILLRGGSPATLAIAKGMQPGAIEYSTRKDANKTKIEKIYADSNDRALHNTDDIFMDFYKTRTEVDDTKTKEAFIRDYINPETAKDGIGNGLLMALFQDNTQEVADFSIDDMRQYMARYDAIQAKYDSPRMANEVMGTWSNQYARDHRGYFKEGLIHANDFAIGMGSYFASQAIGVRQAYHDATGIEHQVFMDLNTRDIVPTSEVMHDSSGDFYVKDGKRRDVSAMKLTDGELYALGKNDDGTEVSNFMNPMYWQDAERFNTWSRDAQKAYSKLGYSPNMILYGPGESQIGWSTTKMSVYGTIDAASTLVTMGGTSLLEAGVKGVAQVAGATSKAARVAAVAAKVTDATIKAIPRFTSTVGIEQAYRQGSFSESLQRNVEAIDNKYLDKFQHEFTDKYSKDKAFKAVIDKSSEEVYQQLLKEQGNTQLNSEDLKIQVQRIVADKYVNDKIEALRKTDTYAEDMQEAIKTANMGAMVTGYTEALKYGALNTVGWRSYLFKNPAKTVLSNIKEKGVYDALKEAGKSVPKKARVWTKEGLKTAWSGGWTNYTDEMQAWGGKYIANDSFDRYMAGKYDGNGVDSSYGVMDGMLSYAEGAIHAMPLGSSIEAGFVGALGSTIMPSFNIAGATTALMTKEGRKSLYTNGKLDKGKALNFMFSNPLMNGYYESKARYEAREKYGKEAQKLLEQSDKDKVDIIKALALQSVDVTNKEDEGVTQFMAAVTAIQALQSMNEKYNTEESESKQSALQKLKQGIRNAFGLDAAEASEHDAYIAELMSQSENYKQALQVLDAINNGVLNEEMTKELLVDYYKHNPNIAQSEENNAVALQLIQQRAQELSQANEIVNKVNADIEKYEKEHGGKKINALTKYALWSKMALKQFIDKRVDDISHQYDISTEVDTEAPVHGTAEAIERQIKDIDKLRESNAKQKEAAQAKLDEATEKVQKYKDAHPEMTKEQQEEYSQLEFERQSAQRELNYREELDYNYLNHQAVLTDEKETADGRVLKKDEILGLDAISMARMLDEANRDDYSKEQQFEIEAAIAELQLNNEGKLDAINEMSDLLIRKQANDHALWAIASNPDAASVQIEAEFNAQMAERNQNALAKITDYFDSIMDTIDKLEVDDATKKSILRFNLRRLSSKVLNNFKIAATVDNPSPALASHIEDINEALDIVPVMENISKILESKKEGTDPEVFAGVRESINSAIENAENKQELLDTIQGFANQEGSHPLFAEIAKELGLAVETKEATKTETKEEKKERTEKEAERKETEAKKEEAAKKETEKVVKEAEESKEKIEGTEKEEAKETKKENKEETKEETKEKDTPVDKEKELTEEEQKKELQSPDEEKQLEQVEGEKEVNTVITSKDNTDNGNNDTTESEQGLIGNRVYPYDLNALTQEKRLVRRTFTGEYAALDKWMQDNGFQHIQEIIDRELNAIIKANPKVQFMYVNNQGVKPGDAAIKDFAFTVVEYTDKVAKAHDESLGGIIESNGKKYLVIGTLGYNGAKSKGDAYRKMLLQLKIEANNPKQGYFASHPTERFYVSENFSTEVSQITSGRLVRMMEKDTSREPTRTSELLADKERNPEGYTLNEVSWAIQYGDKLHTVKVPHGVKVYPPSDTTSNVGGVFLLVPTASGTMIPAAVMPVTLNEIPKECHLYQQINELVHRLGDPNYNNRRSAIDSLIQLLVLSETGNQILIGTESIPTVTLIVGGTKVATYNVTSASFRIEEMVSRIMEDMSPRINVTLSSLLDSSMLADLDEAGALNTDIGYYGTMNAGYSLYDINPDGTPNKSNPVEVPEPVEGVRTNLELAERKENNTVSLNRSFYRYKEGVGWTDKAGRVVTDAKTIEELEIKKLLKDRMRVAPPDLSVDHDNVGNQNVSYYIVSHNGTDRAVKLIRGKENKVLSVEETERLKNTIKKRLQRERQQQEAEKQLGDATLVSSEEVSFDDESTEHDTSDAKNLTIESAEEVSFDEERLKQQDRDETDLSDPNFTMTESFDVVFDPSETSANQESTPAQPVQEVKEEKRQESEEERKKKAADKVNTEGVTNTVASSEKTVKQLSDVVANKETRKRLLDILKAKGIKLKNSELRQWMIDHNIPVDNITDVEEWLSLIENCR